MGLSSPNKMIWSCFRSLQRNVANLDIEHDAETVKDIVASNIVLSVTAVETFTNMYFRVLVEEEKYQSFKAMILEESKPQNGDRAKGLEQKLNSWPNKILNKNINFNKGIGKEFDEIRESRNNLTHFTSDYEPVTIGNIVIKGVANTEVFDSLKKEDAEKALQVAKEFIEHILLLSGAKNKQIPHAIHQWAGLVPEHES